MQNYPDQVTEAMRNYADCFVMSQAWHQTTVHDLEDAPLAFDSSIRSLIENAAHLAVALWRVPAAVHARALFLSWACPYPRGELLG
jgi:hypothetical protein